MHDRSRNICTDSGFVAATTTPSSAHKSAHETELDDEDPCLGQGYSPVDDEEEAMERCSPVASREERTPLPRKPLADGGNLRPLDTEKVASSERCEERNEECGAETESEANCEEEKEKEKENVGTPEGKQGENKGEGVLLIFDWDDTLCPSTWLGMRRLTVDDSCVIGSRDRDVLDSLVTYVKATLDEAKKLGTVLLVTNAGTSSNWSSLCSLCNLTFVRMYGFEWKRLAH